MFLQLDDVVHLQLGQPLLLFVARILQRKRSRQRGREVQLERRSRLREKWPESSTDMNALLVGAQITLTKEECVGGMVQRSNNVTAKGAQIKLSREESASGTGQKLNTNDAAAKDAQI